MKYESTPIIYAPDPYRLELNRRAAEARRQQDVAKIIAAAAAAATAEANKPKPEPKAQLVAEIKTLLTEMGASGVRGNDALGDADRKAARDLLGTDAPSKTVDLLIALARQHWIASTPRLDML